MRIRLALLTLIVSLAVLAEAPIARADQTPAERATALYRHGNELYDAGKFAEAETAYREAWDLQKTYDVATGLGDSALALGRMREAAEHLAYALRQFPARGKAEERKRIEDHLAQAKAQIVTLRINVDVERADVSVNGRRAGLSPLEQEVFADVGALAIEVSREGYETNKRTVQGKKGDQEDLAIHLKKTETPEPRSRVPAYVLGGVGALGVVGGAVLVGLAEGKGNEARKTALATDEKCAIDAASRVGKCAQLAELSSQGNIMGNAGIGAFIVGGTAAAGAAVYLLWPESTPKQATAMRLLPLVDGQRVGLIWLGSF